MRTSRQTGRLGSGYEVLGPTDTGEVKITSKAFASISRKADLNLGPEHDVQVILD